MFPISTPLVSTDPNIVFKKEDMASQRSPPPSPPPDGDRNRGAAIIATQAVFVAIGTVLVLARLYIRSHVIRKFGLDDLFILLGLVRIAYRLHVLSSKELTMPCRYLLSLC